MARSLPLSVFMRNDIAALPLGYEDTPRLLFMGRQACEMTAQMLPASHSILVGSENGVVELCSGSIFDGEMLLIYASPQQVIFTKGDQAFECTAQQFVKHQWQSPTVRKISERGTIRLAQEECAILQSIFVPWYEVLNISVARVGIFYYSLRETMEQALTLAPSVQQIINVCRSRYHKLFNPLPSSTDAGSAIHDLSLYITREGTARFLAQLIKDPARPPKQTLGALQRMINKIIAIVLKTVEALEVLFYEVIAWDVTKLVVMYFFPPAGALMPWVQYDDVKAVAIAEYAQYLALRLGEEGFYLSQAEATAILTQMVDDPGTILKLRDLDALLQHFIPVVDKLHSAYHSAW